MIWEVPFQNHVKPDKDQGQLRDERRENMKLGDLSVIYPGLHLVPLEVSLRINPTIVAVLKENLITRPFLLQKLFASVCIIEFHNLRESGVTELCFNLSWKSSDKRVKDNDHNNNYI